MSKNNYLKGLDEGILEILNKRKIKPKSKNIKMIIKPVDCNSYKKFKSPKCEEHEKCEWVKKQGKKQGYCKNKSKKLSKKLSKKSMRSTLELPPRKSSKKSMHSTLELPPRKSSKKSMRSTLELPPRKSSKKSNCKKYKKNKSPKCNEQSNCKWVKKQGNKIGYCKSSTKSKSSKKSSKKYSKKTLDKDIKKMENKLKISDEKYQELRQKKLDNKKLTKLEQKQLEDTMYIKYCLCIKKMKQKNMPKNAPYGICANSVYKKNGFEMPFRASFDCEKLYK